MEIDNQSNAARLTKQERQIIWIASAIFLAVLLILFFLGLFLPVKTEHPFLPGFYYITEIIAATSAGILAATVAGFFKLELERKVGKSGRITLQATGGFVVFVIIIFISPRTQMSNLANQLFGSLVSDCAQAVADQQTHPNAKALCIELAKRYPKRPEPWRYLAMWHHRNMGGLSDLKKASEYYFKSVSLYGVSFNEKCWRIKDDLLNPLEKISFLEVLAKYAGANADYVLANHNINKTEPTVLENGLTDSEKSINLIIEMADSNTDPSITGAGYDILGKINLYRFFLLPNKEKSRLDYAIDSYDKALSLGTNFNIYLNYHKLFALSLKHCCDDKISDNNIDIERNVFNNFLQSWNNDLDNPTNAPWASQTRAFTKMMINNSRVEQFAVTLPFGSTLFGGKEFGLMLKRHPALMERLQLYV